MRTPAIKSEPAPARAPALGTARPRIPVWLLAVLLVLVTIALYWPATRCDFINFDDPDYVTENLHVQGGLSWESVKWAFINPVSFNWHPLTVMSHMLDCQLFGLNPWGHHLVNVLLHALNAALVFLLLNQMMGLRRGDPQQPRDSPSLKVSKTDNALITATAPQAGATWRSLLVAALFAFHPLRVESVAWVAERKDVLSGFFGLLTLIFYTRYAQCVTSGKSQVTRTNSTLSPVTRHSSRFYMLALFFFALGLLSKPMLVTWPFVMLLLDYWPLKRSSEFRVQSSDSKNGPQPSTARRGEAERRRLNPQLLTLLLEKIPFFVLAAVAGCVTFVVQKTGGSVMTAESLPLGARAGNALVSYCRYLGKLFWPVDLAVFYPHPGYWPLAQVLLAGLLLAVISVLFFVKRRQYPFLLMGWLWFCGMLMPMIGLVQTGGQAMADRHTYIPSLGVLIVAIWGACEVTRRWQHHVIASSVLGCAAIVLCLGLTRQQLGYWQDSETLFRHALEVTENNFLAHNNLGVALDRKGQTDEAIRQFQESIRLKPTYADAHYNLGNILFKKGQTDEAISQFEDDIRLKPDNIDACYNLGTAFYKKGQLDAAIGQFQEVIRLKPDYAEAHYSLGILFGKRGQLDKAISQFREVIHLKPNYTNAQNNLASALERNGQLDEAIRQYEAAVHLAPGYAQAHYNLGTALGKKGQMDEAISQFQEAIRLNPDYAEAHNNLGIALSNKNQIDEAIGQYQEAIRLNAANAAAHNNLGTALDKKGQTDEAIGEYREAIRLNPDYTDAHNNLGIDLDKKGQTDEAMSQYQEAIRLNPDFADAHNNLGDDFAARGRLDEAIQSYRRAIQADPNRPEIFYRLGLILNQLGRTQEAVAQYREALRLNPDLAVVLNNLAWELATSPDGQLRNGPEAVRLAERACELTHYAQPWFVGTLAAAYAEVGRFPEAVGMGEKAKQLATAAGAKGLAGQDQQLLELYRAGKPYHEPAPTGQK